MIPFLDLAHINLRFEKEFTDAFHKSLQSASFILGENVNQFENAFAEYCQVKNCIGVANGLDALIVLLEGYKILGKLKDGDEVIVPSFTFISTALAVTRAGLVPVFAEVGEETFLVNADTVRTKISSRTKALIAVHLYGQCCDMDELGSLCRAENLLLIEDAAQAHGARFKNQLAGSLGDAAAFSFYPGKNLGALGDGGAVVTNDNDLSEIIRTYRNVGAEKKYNHVYKGFNSRLDAMQAAFLSIKLNHLDEDNQRRNFIADSYLKNIVNPHIVLPVHLLHSYVVWHLFVVRVKNRQQFQEHMQTHGIETHIHYPIPVHKQKAFAECNNLYLPVTEMLCNEVVSLPVSPVMTEQQADKVISAVNSYRI